MRSLEEWVARILEQVVNELSHKYSSGDYGVAEKEVDSLPDTEPTEYRASHVEADTLQKMHQKLRNQSCEATIWAAIIFRLSAPLPTQIAHDLIDRDIIVGQLGHTRQDDEIQWRLASLVDEALLTLVWDFFTNPIYEVAQLQKLLSEHPDHPWLLDKWEHWALLSSSVREREKEIVFHRWAWEHPKRPDNLPDPEQYLEIMADKERNQREV